jgi:NADH-quinone oxidoreductase subunit G
MAHMYVDNMKVEIEGEKNVLEVIRKAGIDLPTFCYYSELSTYGACRMCVIENERGGIEAACSTVPRDGMRVKTNTPVLQQHRKMILELILSAHCRDCTTCQKSGSCRLQELAIRFGVDRVRFCDNRKISGIDDSSTSIVRDPSKCILCGDCVRMCSEKQGLGIIDFAKRGSKMEVMPAFNMKLSDTDCVNCGQCAAVCPTGAIVVKDETAKVWEYLNDPKKCVVVQIAPAVRVALGDEFGIEHGENVLGKSVAALKMMGFDKVFDTVLGADITTHEEANEFLERLENGGPFPMFTSCCPAWIKYCETKHPELINKNVSSCKSPMQMFGSVIKKWYDQNDDDRELVSIAIMPCTAKKYEASRKEFTDENGKRIIEVSITTQELANMIRNAGIRFNDLEPEYLDSPFDMGGSGAGVIFGVTGGVAEAVIRACVPDKSAGAIKDIKFCGVRGKEQIKEATIYVDGKKLTIGVVYGLKNIEYVIQAMNNGEMHFDLVEVMACPEGCIGGAGQPVAMRPERDKRAKGLYHTDDSVQIKFADKNPMLKEVYEILGNDAHKELHVHYEQ